MGSQVPSSGNIPSSSHRLPAISASDALRQLRESGARTIPTGLIKLDEILVGQGVAIYGRGGFVRSQLTEVFGPPGSGRTALCLQAAVAVLRDGGHVAWMDCQFPLPQTRLQSAISDLDSAAPSRFHHYQTPSLAHLLALVHRQKTGFPSENTALIVIDDVSILFSPPITKPSAKPLSTPNIRSIASIYQSSLLSSLSRIASTNNIAVLLTSHVITQIRPPAGALLAPALRNKDWEDAISSRIVLFRDFPPTSMNRVEFDEQHGRDILDRLRFAGIIKAHGVPSIENDIFKDVVPFSISDSGEITPVIFPTVSSAPPLIRSPAPKRKRKLDEIPDSEEDWDAELESLDGFDFDETELQILAVRPVDTADTDNSSKKIKTESNEEM